MTLRSLIISVAVGVLGGLLPAQEGSLASELPAGTTAYFEIPDIQAIVEGSGHSALGRIFNEPDVQEFIGPAIGMLDQGWEMLRGMAAEQGIPPQLLHWEALTSFEAGFCLLPGETRQPRICMAFAVGFKGDLSGQVFNLISGMVQEQGAGQVRETNHGRTIVIGNLAQREQFEVWQSGSRLVGMLRIGDLPSASLAGDPEFAAARNAMRGQGGLMFGYFDFNGMMQAMSRLAEQSGSEGAILGVLVHNLGLDSLDHMAFTSGWREGDSFSTGVLSFAEGGPRGIFAVESEAVDLGILEYIPDKATSFSAATMNTSGLWHSLLEGVRKSIPPEIAGQLADVGHPAHDWLMGEKSQWLTSVFDGFGDRSFSYSVTSGSLMGGGGESGTFMEVKDVRKVREFLGGIVPAAAQFLDNMKEIPLSIDTKRITLREQNEEGEMVTREGPEYYTLKIRAERLPDEMRQAAFFLGQIQPTFGVSDDGWLVSSFSGGSTVRKVLRKGLEKPERSILERKEVRRFVDSLPEGVSTISWSDPRPTVEGMITAIQSALPMAAGMIPPEAADQIPFDFMAFPGPDAFVRHLRPSESYAAIKGNRIITSSVGSIDGVDIIAGMGAACSAILPLVGMWAKPAMSQPEEYVIEAPPPPEPGEVEYTIDTDQRSTTMKELYRIESGILVFELEYSRLPKSLDELAKPHEHYPKGFLPQPERGLVSDPWGNDFVFSTKASGGYEVYSKGPNGKDDGGAVDDIALSGD